MTPSTVQKKRRRNRSKMRPLWFPHYWTSWLAVFALYLLSLLPMPTKQRWGQGIGRFLKGRLKSRYRVTQTNIQVCFPELCSQGREQLVERSFVACARGFLESTHAWWRDMQPYQEGASIFGKEHLEEALASGRGVLLIGAHYSILDFALPLIACHLTKPGYMYRPNNNPVIDRTIEKGRRRHFNIRAFSKRQLPEMIEFLKEGGQVWYACDQDFGQKSELFAPFFGMPAACITTPSYIARESGAAVICVSHLRTANGQYQIEFSPIEKDFGTHPQRDTDAWNRFIETSIRQHPDQYLWMHKRFKTRPEGAAKLY